MKHDPLIDRLEQTSKGPLILLFYDGFERPARPGFVGGITSQLHRLARYTKRTLCRQQVRTGFYTVFLAFCEGLRQIGCHVQVNNFAMASARPSYPIGIFGYPTVIDKITLPNPAIIGPGDFGLPPVSGKIMEDPRFKTLLHLSQWPADVYQRFAPGKIATCFAGIDTDRWQDVSNKPKTIDFLIYDKIRWHRDTQVPAVLERVTRYLDKTGHSYKILRYGQHHQSEFIQGLNDARAMIFLCEHETQGLAYQEALASNIPVLAWDEGKIIDPDLQPFVNDTIPVSSVPYFSEQCGMTFLIENFEEICDAFWNKKKEFTPRHYIETHLSMQISGNQYLTEYARLAS